MNGRCGGVIILVANNKSDFPRTQLLIPVARPEMVSVSVLIWSRVDDFQANRNLVFLQGES